MVRRVGVILLLLFEAVWLNVILPGHTRGAVALPGPATPVETCGGCCAAKPAEDSPPQKSAPSKERAARCAICAFAARLTTPTSIDLRLPPLARLEIAPLPEPVSILSHRPHATHYGRAPPTA
jgi:hypothetical protein